MLQLQSFSASGGWLGKQGGQLSNAWAESQIEAVHVGAVWPMLLSLCIWRPKGASSGLWQHVAFPECGVWPAVREHPRRARSGHHSSRMDASTIRWVIASSSFHMMETQLPVRLCSKHLEADQLLCPVLELLANC